MCLRHQNSEQNFFRGKDHLGTPFMFLGFASFFSLISFSMQTWSMLNLCKVGLFWYVCVKLLFIKCYISIFLQCIQWTSWVWIPFANITVERSLPVCMPSQNLWRCYCLFGFGSPSSQPSLLLSFFLYFVLSVLWMCLWLVDFLCWLCLILKAHGFFFLSFSSFIFLYLY